MQKEEWVLRPVCGNKTRFKIRDGTVLINFPLDCPKCRQESLVDAQNFENNNSEKKEQKIE